MAPPFAARRAGLLFLSPDSWLVTSLPARKTARLPRRQLLSEAVKRWKSPQTAARLAARAAKQAAQERSKSWKAWLMLAFVILLAAAALALYSWSYIDVHRKTQKRRHERLSETNHQAPMRQSNSVAFPPAKPVHPEQP